MPPNTCRGHAAAAFAFVLVACAGTDPRTVKETIARRDSSGVEIVEVNSDPWKAPVWAVVDTVNVIRVGQIDSIPATMFRRLAIADRQSNGNVLTLDWETGEVHVWSSTGSHVRQVGRTGQGPGEFEYPNIVRRGPGDTIHVYNPDQAIDVFTPDGVFVRHMRMGSFSPLRALSDGSYLMSRGDDVEIPLGRVPLYRTIFRLTTEGDTTREYARYMRTEILMVGPRRERINQLFSSPRFAAGTSSGFVWCDAGTFVCDLWTEEGRKFRSLRFAVTPVPVTGAHIEEYRRQAYGENPTPQRRQSVDDGIARSERSATLPFWAVYLVDEMDRFWFREHRFVESQISTRWVVVGADGEIFGSITLPVVDRVLKIGSDYILALVSDSTDAQLLAIYKHAPVK